MNQLENVVVRLCSLFIYNILNLFISFIYLEFGMFQILFQKGLCQPYKLCQSYKVITSFSIVGQFPYWTVSRLTLPRGQIPDWHFADGHFPDGHFLGRTIPRRDTSWRRPPRPDISPLRLSPTGHFPDHNVFSNFCIFLAKLFVKANGLDFPLFFSWSIISSINFIYAQFIYKRFNLLNIACQCFAIIFS